MNLKVISSKASREVYVIKLFLKVTILFFGPTQHPLIIIQSFLITPYLGKPPIGLISLSVKSTAVEALLLTPAFPIL